MPPCFSTVMKSVCDSDQISCPNLNTVFYKWTAFCSRAQKKHVIKLWQIVNVPLTRVSAPYLQCRDSINILWCCCVGFWEIYLHWCSFLPCTCCREWLGLMSMQECTTQLCHFIRELWWVYSARYGPHSMIYHISFCCRSLLTLVQSSSMLPRMLTSSQ